MSHLKNVFVWLHALAAAAVGGGATSIAAGFALPDQVNFSHDGMIAMGKIAAAGAVLAIAAYLKQSPLPKPCDPDLQ